MKAPKAGECTVRFVEPSDILELERIYLAHEDRTIPEGYFSDFQETIRSESVDCFVATVNGRVVGGGGVMDYHPGVQASLTFGIVDPEECRKGYGTSIILSRLLFIDPGVGGCQISLEATPWSADFFTRLGFTWYDRHEDEAGNRFQYGTHMIYPGDEKVFRKILSEGSVELEFVPDRGRTACENFLP